MRNSVSPEIQLKSVDETTKAIRKEFDEIELIGLCTDICVISNALLVKAFGRDFGSYQVPLAIEKKIWW